MNDSKGRWDSPVGRAQPRTDCAGSIQEVPLQCAMKTARLSLNSRMYMYIVLLTYLLPLTNAATC